MQHADHITERNAHHVRRFLDHTHSGRFEIIDEVVDEAIVTHGFPCAKSPESRAEYKAFFAELAEQWADMRFDLHALVADRDFVAARFTVSGTHVGEVMGIAATGRPVRFDGMALYRMRDGRIAETWLHPDGLSILQQIAELPAA